MRWGWWLLACWPGVVLAGETSQAARSLVATCANCHGTEGAALAGSGMPALAGQNRAAILDKLQAFRRGEASPTIMHQIARGYTESQLAAIADYLSAQRHWQGHEQGCQP